MQQLGDIRVGTETIATGDALGRITGARYVSPTGLPAFARSSMDGYSVRAADTFGATASLPAYLSAKGEVPMGRAPDVTLGPGDAAVAFTGGMLAHGADAVVMVEHTQIVPGGQVESTTIEVTRPVAPGENVIQQDEDVSCGEEVLAAGHALRPQDIGALLALGITRVTVAQRPRVAIVSTGDEVISPEKAIGPGQVRDINTYTVAALVDRAGGIPVPVGIFPDDLDTQRTAARKAMALGDVVIFSAGSSMGSRDMTAAVLSGLGEPGVLVHGIAIKPGKPTIAGLAGETPIFGLPGNPVSAMVVFDLLVRPVIRTLMGSDSPELRPTVTAPLTRDVPSISGRQDYFPVALIDSAEGKVAEPIFGKSNLIFTLVRADGLASVPLNSGGLYAGEQVQVVLF
jgi:molybdopterin molybdotransferase